MMVSSVHNPDQYMASLRQIIAQGRKRLGLIVGAGAPASIKPDGKKPLIPAVAGLTSEVMDKLSSEYGKTLTPLCADLTDPNIENILSRVRGLSSVIGTSKVHGMDGNGFKKLSEAICTEIGSIVNKELPLGSSPYTELAAWISGSERTRAIEIFTTNYDLLFEEALERAKLPYFDGFTGSNLPFFDPSTVANDDLPARWTRLWKLHGSLGWSANEHGEVIRAGNRAATQLIFPEHLKYDLTQKAPYAALFDRLRTFLMTPDTLLISIGFSFADAHISARIDECLAANTSASLFAFQFSDLSGSSCGEVMALRRANMSLYAPNGAIINGISGPWVLGDLPTKDWSAIRSTYWGAPKIGATAQFLLGSFDCLTRFFASSRASQHEIPATVLTGV